MRLGKKRVMIAPIGFYEKRVWRSILYRGMVDRLYLLLDNKPGYKEIGSEILEDFRSMLKELFPYTELKIIEMDLSNLHEIYRILPSIILKERLEDPHVEITVDFTSATKWMMMALLHLYFALPLDIKMTYTPGKNKLIPEKIQEQWMLVKDDEGRETYTFPIPLPVKPRPDNIEIKILIKLLKRKYKSISELTGELARDEGKDLRTMERGEVYAYKRRVIAIVDRLIRSGFIISIPRGREKSLELSEIGEALSKGLLKIYKQDKDL